MHLRPLETDAQTFATRMQTPPTPTQAPCPLQPQSKKKPHQIFRQAFFSLAENPSFLASPPLLQRKKSTTPRYNVFLSRERQEKVYLQSTDTSFRRNPVLSTPCR